MDITWSALRRRPIVTSSDSDPVMLQSLAHGAKRASGVGTIGTIAYAHHRHLRVQVLVRINWRCTVHVLLDSDFV